MTPARLVPVAAILAAAAPVAAQTRDCELVRAAKARSIASESTEIWFVSGPAEFTCTDGTVVRADSAVLTRGVSLELIGHVFYADSARTLDAERAVYYMEAARLVAQDSVVLTDRQNQGSVIRGPRLTYERPGPERPQARTIVTGRPHAILFPRDSAEAAPRDTAARPFEIDADWMEMHGEGRFSATGNVAIVRGDTRSGAGVATFDQAGELLVLTGDSWIQQEDLRLEGQSIEARLAGEQLREVVARQDARLEGRDLDVEAATIRLEFADRVLQRLIAVAPVPVGGAERARAVALARDLRLVADSIDALAPGQELRQITAVGDAFAQRGLDSLSAALPELLAGDWVSGDTIDAYFVPARPPADSSAAAAPPDSSGRGGAAGDSADVVLERLVVAGPGGRAQALYHVTRRSGEPGPRAINYTIADRIVLILSEGEVAEAEATGEVRGRYLEPVRGSVSSTSGRGPEPGRRRPAAEPK